MEPKPTDTAQAAVSAPTKNEAKVTIRQYRFDGTWPLEQKELMGPLADTIGKSVTFADLEKTANDLTHLLRRKGYLVATAYIPMQDFADGTVHLAVMIGTFDGTIIENKTGAADRVLKREIRSVRKGHYIERDPLERGILIAGDLPRTDIKAFLKAGKERGTSDLVLQAERKGEDFWGYAGFDNGGYHYTGKYQYSLFMNYANPFHAGDLLSIGGVFSAQAGGMWSGSISWQSPILVQGLRLGISYGRSHYALGGPYASLDYAGQSDTFSTWLQYSLHRSKPSSVYALLRYDNKKLSDGSDAYDFHTPKTASEWTVGINGDAEDKWHGGGKNNYSLTYTWGDLSIDDELSYVTDMAPLGPHTSGGFGKWNFMLTRDQRISERESLCLSYQRQWARKNLDSSEKLSLGGPYGVRAYPVGEASGDDGWLWSAEYRNTLPKKEGASDIWQLIAFVDGGHVGLYHDSRGDYTGSRSLYGMGIGINWSRKSQWVGRLHYAWRLGPEHAKDSREDSRGRLWFQLYRLFS